MTCRPPAAENPASLPETCPRQPGVLALLADQKRMQPLLQHLQALGMQVDTANDLAAARTLFFGNGGHDALVVGPDVQPGLAQRVLQSLRAIDPELPMATFGPPLGAAAMPAHSAMLAAFHPSSRAGTGALVRFLRALRLR